MMMSARVPAKESGGKIWRLGRLASRICCDQVSGKTLGIIGAGRMAWLLRVRRVMDWVSHRLLQPLEGS